MNAPATLDGMRTVVDDLVGLARSTTTLTVAGQASKPDACVPWASTYEQARREAMVLARQGIGRGSRVGLLADTGVGLVTAIQAVWFRGAAFAVLPWPGRAMSQAQRDHLCAIVTDARLDLLIADDAAEVPPALEAVVRVCRLSILEGTATHAEPGDILRPDPGDLAVLQYTSGSTRNPRGVPVSHGNLAANLAAIEAAAGRDVLNPATARWMSWLPLYHDMGLFGFLTLPMSRGCSLVLQAPLAFALSPRSWLDRLSHHRATVTGAPNFAYALMTRLLEAGTPADLGSLRIMYSGGEPIDAQMMSRFTAAAARQGLDPHAVMPAYGLAESTLAVSLTRRGGVPVDLVDRGLLEREGIARPADGTAPSRRLTRLGPAVPGTQIRIVAEKSGRPVAERTVGHIEVSGPSVVAGYWGEAERPTAWLRTGDLGYLTEGDLVVCGRAKDVLFAAGRNIYPQDVEAAAAQVPGVRAGGAAAFGVPSDHGDRLVVAVECRGPDDSALRTAVSVAVAAETGIAPADVVTLRFGCLPKTSSGKLRRAETQRRYLTGELTPMHRSVQ